MWTFATSSETVANSPSSKTVQIFITFTTIALNVAWGSFVVYKLYKSYDVPFCLKSIYNSRWNGQDTGVIGGAHQILSTVEMGERVTVNPAHYNNVETSVSKLKKLEKNQDNKK